MVSIWEDEADDKSSTLKNIESSSSLASADMTITANYEDTKNATATLDVPKASGSRSKSPDLSATNLRCRRVAEVSESLEDDSSSAVSSNESPSGLVRETSCTEPTSTTNLDPGADGEPKTQAEKGTHGVYKIFNYEIPSKVHIGYLLAAMIVILLLSAGFMIYQLYVSDRGVAIGSDNWVSESSHY